MALLKYCAKLGCKELIPAGQRYCKKHAYLEAKRQKTYDSSIRYKRDKKYADFYRSREWLRTQGFIIDKYMFDIYAYYIYDITVIASTAHHIEELKDAWELRLTINNLFPMTGGNHKRIHALYRRDKRGTQQLLRELLNRWQNDKNRPGGGQNCLR